MTSDGIAADQDGTHPDVGQSRPPVAHVRPGQQPGPRPPGQAGDPIRAPAHRVSPRARPYWAVRAALGWAVPAAVLIVALLANWRFLPVPGVLLAATLLLAVVHVAVMPPWRYRVHRWEISSPGVSGPPTPTAPVPPAVFTRSGWWTQRRRIAPLSRVQTVDTTRGPLARLFGLSTVTVTTASAAGPVEIAALDTEVAERIARMATEAAQATRDDAT